MSIEAIRWAFAQQVSHSSAKFVLVALADYAGPTWQAYPSVAEIARATGQDRKTVLANIRRLSDCGLISDTGSRKGATGQVVIYRLNGTENGTVKESQKRNPLKRESGAGDPHYGNASHYVYRLHREDTGQFYIGVRLTVGDPASDRYMGSGRWPEACRASGVKLIKTVLSRHATREEAEREELRLIDKYLVDPLCMNSPKTGTVQTVPNLDGKSPVFPCKESRFSAKESQKRDTEPPEPSGTVRATKRKSAPASAVARPDEVGEQVWADWQALRKAKKAPITPTVLRNAQSEAEKAGLPLERFLEIWCARGSQGLQADWLKPNERAGPQSRPSASANFRGKTYAGTPIDQLPPDLRDAARAAVGDG